MLALLNYDPKDNDVEFSIGLTEAHPAKQQFDRARYCLCLAVAYIWLRWRRRNKCECHDDRSLPSRLAMHRWTRQDWLTFRNWSLLLL
jgi:hypothetical protein